jgi:hypothetical protein
MLIKDIFLPSYNKTVIRRVKLVISHLLLAQASPAITANWNPRQLQPEGQGVIYNFLTTYASSIINLTCSIVKLKFEPVDQVIRIYQDLLSIPKITSITERDSSFPGGRLAPAFPGAKQ